MTKNCCMTEFQPTLSTLHVQKQINSDWIQFLQIDLQMDQIYATRHHAACARIRQQPSQAH